MRLTISASSTSFSWARTTKRVLVCCESPRGICTNPSLQQRHTCLWPKIKGTVIDEEEPLHSQSRKRADPWTSRPISSMPYLGLERRGRGATDDTAGSLQFSRNFSRDADRA